MGDKKKEKKKKSKKKAESDPEPKQTIPPSSTVIEEDKTGLLLKYLISLGGNDEKTSQDMILNLMKTVLGKKLEEDTSVKQLKQSDVEVVQLKSNEIPLSDISDIFKPIKIRLESATEELTSFMKKAELEKNVRIRMKEEELVSLVQKTETLFSSELEEFNETLQKLQQMMQQIKDQSAESSMKVKSNLSDLNSEKAVCLDLFQQVKLGIKESTSHLNYQDSLARITNMVNHTVRSLDIAPGGISARVNSSPKVDQLERKLVRKNRIISALLKRVRNFQHEKQELMRQIRDLHHSVHGQLGSSFSTLG